MRCERTGAGFSDSETEKEDHIGVKSKTPTHRCMGVITEVGTADWCRRRGSNPHGIATNGF